MKSSVLKDFKQGFLSIPQAFSWLRRHKYYLAIAFIPLLFTLVFFFFASYFVIENQEVFLSRLLFADDTTGFFWSVFHYLNMFLAYVLLLIGVFLSSILLGNIVAAPLYEILSSAVERDMRGGMVSDIGLWKSLFLIGEEIKKVLFITVLSFVLFFIPGLALITSFVAAFLIAWDLYDYGHARTGLKFKNRLSYLWKDGAAIAGMSLWLMIPFLQFFVIPLAVVGGTMIHVLKSQSRIAKDLST